MEKIDFFNKSVILRTDYNVPILNERITSTKRIDESMRTIKYILKQSPKKLIIISHMGRPKNNDPTLSLLPVKKYLEKKLECNIHFSTLETYISNNSNLIVEKIVLLENIRYYPEETKNISTTQEFQSKLSSLGNVYINDAFGCSHRKHSSIIGINTPIRCCGFLIEKEKKYLQGIFNRGKKYTLILGGSKISDKIKLINNLVPKVDNILIGGGMAFTFLKYFGTKIGKSLFCEEEYKLVPNILYYAVKTKTNIVLPKDFICNDVFSNEGNIVYKDSSGGIPQNFMGLDIGIKTITEFKNILNTSDYIIWNGPLGVFEFDNFSTGSKEIMKFISELSATTIIGGGDTAACCEMFNLSDKMTHVSTGGGASLELLEGKNLPGLF